MPEPPSSSLITHYVFENPWPLGLVLLAAGLVVLYRAAREGSSRGILIAAALGGAGALVLALGTMITTAGEHGERVVDSLVQAVVSEDMVGGMTLFSDDAVMNSGSVEGPGFGYGAIQNRLRLLAERYDIESNLIMSMRGYSLPDDQAEVHLTCRTIVNDFPAVSRWVLRAKRLNEGGEWKIVRLTCISINGDAVPIDRAW